ncbi:MAG: hypothetical protein HFI75_10110 [Lachnospiraceae bacterium]|nr:hypothetical protein [Lachnospiraceae bacterium]
MKRQVGIGKINDRIHTDQSMSISFRRNLRYSRLLLFTHRKLMELGGKYAQMFEMQAEKYQ